MKAYVLIKTSGGKAKEVLSALKGLAGVIKAHGVYGSVDLIAELEAEDLPSLVVDKIRKLEGVVDTSTLIVAL